ncbi:heavy metal translocating P-type ATPase [Dietzia cercidiphylli]|uniref:heavy metal translocating P-type ATPase n=1 Tax=Dietzia cercidiphylli TaxID=498199 RepID=UPI003F7D63A5
MSDACGCGPDEPLAGEHEDRGPEKLWQVTEIRAAAIAGLLLLAGLILGWTAGPHAAGSALSVLALLVAGYTFVPSTLRRLVRGRIGVGTLMTIAAAGAVILGQIEEAAVLAFLFAISEGLEEYSVARTRRGLRSLLSLVPSTATVLRGGRELRVEPDDLRLGEVMIVRPGERIATDGTIRAGRTALDNSAITGESVPVEAGPGDEVYSGSINGSGALEVTVTAEARDNSLARIVRIVEAEQSRKGEAQRLADTVARPLVPGILVAAALIAVVGSLLGDPQVWIERALVVLVAASPCALAISVPVTVYAAVGAASRFGVLVKGGGALEALGRIRGIALDKTGTLTRGRPAVVEIATADGVSGAEVLAVAAALEARSEHPLAAAILDAAGHEVPAAREVTAVTGAGLTGLLDGRSVRLGRPGWIRPGPLASDVERMQHHSSTAVLVEREGEVLGAIAVRDEPRPEAAEVVAALRRDGYQVAMLTGDNGRTARALAAEVGLDDVHADLRPEDKARIVTRLRAERATAMVGDGVNDAPALATADLGIAMGAMGNDVAIETADVALLGEDLRHLPRALQHARRSRRIMLQNIGLSLAIIIGLVPLALAGVLGLAAVVLVHELAEILVIANGVRAGRTHRGLSPGGATAPAPRVRYRPSPRRPGRPAGPTGSPARSA